ncbi:MAG: hypothetical protein ACRDL7_00130, partial [Gaiellaceae bacterium]
MWKTYRPGGLTIYKSLEGLNPTGEEDFWNIMQSNYKVGLPPPSSFGSIFHRLFRIPWPRVSVVAPFREYKCGAWSMALERGTFREQMYHYDLNSAYRWAACQGLPILKSGKRVYDLEADNSVFAVEFQESNRPRWFTENVGMVTSEELQTMSIKPKLLFGVQFRDWFSFGDVFREIDTRFPWCFKRIGRAFWGRWNGETEVEQHGWARGHKMRPLSNPLHNPIWSHFITSRVKLRLLEAVKMVGAVHVQVDAVLCRDPLPVSEEVGGWKLVQEYPNGVWIFNTGQWGFGEMIVKRMGMNQREAEQWLIQKK